MNDPNETPALDAMQQEIEKLRYGNRLLEDVWRELGPYDFPRDFPLELKVKIADFFGFDDSE